MFCKACLLLTQRAQAEDTVFDVGMGDSGLLRQKGYEIMELGSSHQLRVLAVVEGAQRIHHVGVVACIRVAYISISSQLPQHAHSHLSAHRLGGEFLGYSPATFLLKQGHRAPLR